MRLLETIQVSPQTIGGGTLSVPVTREADPQRTVRAARVYSSLAALEAAVDDAYSRYEANLLSQCDTQLGLAA